MLAHKVRQLFSCWAWFLHLLNAYVTHPQRIPASTQFSATRKPPPEIWKHNYSARNTVVNGGAEMQVPLAAVLLCSSVPVSPSFLSMLTIPNAMESTAPAADALHQVRYKAGMWNISSVSQSTAPLLTSRLGFFWTKVAHCFLREVKLLFVTIPCQGLLSVRSHRYIAGKLTSSIYISAQGGNSSWCI